MREEAHFVTCERPRSCERDSRFDENRQNKPTRRMPADPSPPNFPHLERRLRAPAFERSHHEFTKYKPRQRVGMAKPVSGEWLALQNLRGLPGDRPAV